MESYYWQVRRGTTLVWDGEDEEAARAVLSKDPEYTLHRETWIEGADNNPVRVEQIKRVVGADLPSAHVPWEKIVP